MQIPWSFTGLPNSHWHSVLSITELDTWLLHSMHCMYAMHCFKNAKCIVSDFKHAICMHCFDFLKKCMVSIKNFWKFKKICLKMHCFGQKVKKCIAFFSHFRKNACMQNAYFRKILKLHTMQQPWTKDDQNYPEVDVQCFLLLKICLNQYIEKRMWPQWNPRWNFAYGHTT